MGPQCPNSNAVGSNKTSTRYSRTNSGSSSSSSSSNKNSSKNSSSSSSNNNKNSSKNSSNSSTSSNNNNSSSSNNNNSNSSSKSTSSGASPRSGFLMISEVAALAASNEEALGAPPRGLSSRRKAASTTDQGGPPKTRRLLKQEGAPKAILLEKHELQQPDSKPEKAGYKKERELNANTSVTAAAAATVATKKSLSLDDRGGPWIDLGAPPEELRPSACLMAGTAGSVQCCSAAAAAKMWCCVLEGQTFRFSPIADNVWEGPVGRRIFQIKEGPHTTLYRCVFDEEGPLNGGPPGSGDEAVGAPAQRQEAALRRFFQLDVQFGPMVKKWGLGESPGCRVLALDPVEALFSFICSANNNIPRITLMVRRLCEAYGPLLVKGGTEAESPSGGPLGGPHPCLTWHAFPSVSSLAEASEEALKALGLGYRARLVKGAAERLIELGGPSFLEALRWQKAEAEGPPFAHLKAATAALLQLP
ncbi:hypothetical protein Emed_000315 [Eimeria media]